MHVLEMNASGDRRSWCLVFETGDRVMETLEAFARENAVRGAHVKALGAFRRATLAFFDWETKEYQEIPVDEQVEVAALVGDVGVAPDGGVALHLHGVLSRPDGTPVAGHLLDATVRPTLEMFLVDEGTPLTREKDPRSGLPLIRP